MDGLGLSKVANIVHHVDYGGWCQCVLAFSMNHFFFRKGYTFLLTQRWLQAFLRLFVLDLPSSFAGPGQERGPGGGLFIVDSDIGARPLCYMCMIMVKTSTQGAGRAGARASGNQRNSETSNT